MRSYLFVKERNYFREIYRYWENDTPEYRTAALGHGFYPVRGSGRGSIKRSCTAAVGVHLGRAVTRVTGISWAVPHKVCLHSSEVT